MYNILDIEVADFEIILPIIFGIFIVLSLTLVVFYDGDYKDHNVNNVNNKQHQQEQQQHINNNNLTRFTYNVISYQLN